MNKKSLIEKTFVPIHLAADSTGVPEQWLRVQVSEGKIPAIRTGRRWLVHLERTRAKLTELAEQTGGA